MEVIDVPTDILNQLQQRNQKHFGQAKGTPFTIPPLSDDLGFTSMTIERDTGFKWTIRHSPSRCSGPTVDYPFTLKRTSKRHIDQAKHQLRRFHQQT
jgi:hypothetical protein